MIAQQLANGIVQFLATQRCISQLDAIDAEDSYATCHEAEAALLRFLDEAGHGDVAAAYRRVRERYGRTPGFWHA